MSYFIYKHKCKYHLPADCSKIYPNSVDLSYAILNIILSIWLLPLKKRRFWGEQIVVSWRDPTRKMKWDYLQEHEVTGQRVIALNWPKVGLDYILGGDSLLWRWWSTRTGSSQKMWVPYPWKYWRPGWKERWATWSSTKCPCPHQGELHNFSGPFQSKPFYDSMV